jgi:hypothetical protein
LLPQLRRAGQWFLRSGIQESGGGVARYYRSDTQRNQPVSTEITGYAVSALLYAGEKEGALESARFLARRAWSPALASLPFELDPPAHTYFFDCGIVTRGLLAAWRATGDEEFLTAARSIGASMRDFVTASGECHPILKLPAKAPLIHDPLRWSQAPGCYQLKSAMAWWDLWEATGDTSFRDNYERVLEYALHTWGSFLPGHPERPRVMDRLHAFSYFLEGLLPRVDDALCRAALCDGIRRAASLLREIAPLFERSDVYAQILRVRLYADWAGAVPLNIEAAAYEAEQLLAFQASSSDLRIDGGYYFGRKAGEWLPFVNPVSTAFAMQALALWEARDVPVHRHMLI